MDNTAHSKTISDRSSMRADTSSDDLVGAVGPSWEDYDPFSEMSSDGEGRRTKWDIRRERTRNQILLAGREIFAARDETPRVEDIAKRAGISRAAFYLHFKSLEEVVVEVFKREILWQLRRYFSLTPDVVSSETKTTVWLKRFCASFRKEREYMMVINRALSLDNGNLAVVYDIRQKLILDLGRRLPELGIYKAGGAVDRTRMIRFSAITRELEDVSLNSAFDSMGEDFEDSIAMVAGDIISFVRSAPSKR